MRLKKINSVFKIAMISSLSLSACVATSSISTQQPSSIPSNSTPVGSPANTNNSSNNPNSEDSNTNTNPINTSAPSVVPSNQSTNSGQTLTLSNGFLQASYTDYYSTDLKWSFINGANSYRIYQNGQLIADNITSLNYAIKNLTPNTDYTFEISAVNNAGESNRSSLKVRTFIPSSSSSNNNSNNSSNNNNSNVITTPTPPTGTVIFEGGYQND